MLRICKTCGRTFEGDPGALKCPECAQAERRDTLRPRLCRACGVAFEGGPRAWYCPACRAERRRQHDQAYKQRQRAGHTRPIGSTAHCEICGQPYTVRGSLQRYCDKCAPEATRQAANALSRAWNAEHTTPQGRRAERRLQAAEIPCAVCGKYFVPHDSSKTCSPACSAELRRRTNAAWIEAHREAYAAHKREYYQKRKADKARSAPDADKTDDRH